MMYLRYLPFVIEQGKLYAATPPLYSIPLGKGKMKFFANNIEYIEYVFLYIQIYTPHLSYPFVC